MSTAPNKNSTYYQYPDMKNNGKKIPSKVEITISCKNLPKFDKLSKSDPKIFIFIENKLYNGNDVTSLWKSIGSTERIKNNENPVFTKSFIIDYYFEMIQNLRFVVFDMDSDSDEWKKNDYIGYVEKTLGELISSSKDNGYLCDILTAIPSGIEVNNSKAQSHHSTSTMLFKVREIVDSPIKIKFDITCEHIDKKDTFGKSDPFVIISRIEDDDSKVKVLEASVIKNTLNPVWNNLEISESALINGDPDRKLFFEVYDWDKNSENDLIGTFTTTFSLLIKQKSFMIINEKKKEKKGDKYVNSGVLFFKITERPKTLEFVDFPLGGTEILVSFAIDFTASNGQPSEPDSLHYKKPNYDPNNFNTLNEYQKAISSIGYVLEPYDSNRYMEIYGYGARFFNRKTVEHDCSLTGDPDNPSVFRVAGILETYHKALQTVKLSGPTNFAPIINKMASKAREGLAPKNTDAPLHKYHILTILTDGAISDMENTKKAIVEASDAPLSIIIIGIGKSNFGSMNVLDGDNNKLSSGGKTSERDIVQFVPLSKYINDPSLLASETLAEIPKQVLEFSKLYKYRPPKYYYDIIY
ncbi:Copine-domain-containing protein [Anaeromyces robustus]|uniref:Copine-domain-containing protein n=1 Tax=Anaeromyces robustus TaxID=1754192 RepID=A0A1Y1XB71_9FUNG|nr:Copine-domain-containing protein [Anaeromyces robustus]|eukprot:ORX82967.1 Copine-domain-containing protein [Anaeromyces robustus]